MTLQSEIQNGLDAAGWDESIFAVKHIIAKALSQLDRSANIKDTGYFNHSFVPDFILKWPSGERTRDVFLRIDSSPGFLNADIHAFGERGPMLFSLGGFDVIPPQPDGEGLQATLDVGQTNAMLIEPSAIEELGSINEQASFGQVLPAAILRGGRGLVVEETAQGLTEASKEFFEGAREHDSEEVASAAPLLENHLNPGEAARLMNFGRIIWEATGGEPADFPVETELADTDDAGLRFLLNEGPASDSAFWRSIGGRVSLDRLLSLGIASAPNLGPFVRANADRISARVLLVKAAESRVLTAGSPWSIEAGGLAFAGADFRAYLATRRATLTVKPDESPGLNLQTLRERLTDERVETVTLVAGGGQQIEIRSDEVLDPATDVVVASVGGLPGATVESVGLAVRGTFLKCDFTSRVASGHTNARFDILTLLDRGMKVLWPVTDSVDIAEIAAARQASSPVPLADSPAPADANESPIHPPEVLT